MTLTLRLYLIVFLFLAGCGGDKPSAQGVKGGQFSFTTPAAQVDVSTAEFITADVEVNGVPARFILDTGADAFVVSPEFAARAGLRPTGTTQIVTIAGSSPARVWHIDDFRLANVTGIDIEAAEASLAGIDGVIGVPFFRAVAVGVDYAAGSLDLIDPETISAGEAAAELNGEMLPAENFVLNNVLINGINIGPLRIDTGNSGGVRLGDEQAAPLLTASPQAIPVTSSASNGQVPGQAFIAEEITVGGAVLPQQFVVVQRLPLEPGLLGNLVLRQFYVLFDLAEGQIVLRQDRELRYRLADPSAGPGGFNFSGT